MFFYEFASCCASLNAPIWLTLMCSSQLFGDYTALVFWIRTTNLVLTLFFLSSPTAIIWFVIAVIVYSIQGLSKGFVSHVSQEISKIFPAVTNLYASAAVSVPMLVIWIGAALKHAIPASVNSIPFTNARMSMLEARLAPATKRVSTSQVVGLDNGFIATVTSAVPASFFSTTARWTYDHNHSKALICKIDFIRHALIVP
jgi:hypothetical protein